ncbi:hypothetical protein, partial [uncultured Lamprocystis sp.]|uniref:hypothetical protein n=1 Tax=uncultured Lamprocystis sp. TaxID=543132 RepID=UPI0025CC20F9
MKVIVVGLARLHPIILAEFNASDYFSLYIIILRVRLEVVLVCWGKVLMVRGALDLGHYLRLRVMADLAAQEEVQTIKAGNTVEVGHLMARLEMGRGVLCALFGRETLAL